MCYEHSEDDIIRSIVSLQVVESTGQDLLSDEVSAPHGILRYDSSEPYAVTLLCHARSGVAWWYFGRDLLSAGLLTAAGEGDVRITPSIATNMLRLELRSSTVSLTVDVEMADVAKFLDLTFDVVPVGSESEHLDLDSQLAKLAS